MPARRSWSFHLGPAPRVADHPSRRALLEAIAASPGIRFLELRRATGFPNGVLLHHLRKLEEAGLVEALRSRKYLAFVAAGASPAADRHPALHSPGAQRLAEAIRGEPGLHVKEAAARAGVDSSTASYHLRRMAAGGLVTLERESRRLRIRWLDGPAWQANPMGVPRAAGALR